MRQNVRWKSIRLAAFASAAVGAAACSDSSSPTGVLPHAEASFAAGTGSIVKSMSGLEPLLDASTNISGPSRISDLGQVVGFSRNSVNENRAVIWDGSVFPQDLGSLGGPSTTAAAITPDGSVIVGNSSRAGSTAPVAVRWVRVNGAWTIDELPMLNGATTCSAIDIGGNGTILGSCQTTTSEVVVVWRNGIVTELGAGRPTAVSNNNQVLVNVSDEPQIWDLRTTPVTVTSLGKLKGNPTTGRDINDAGDVVGDARFDGPSAHAFVWTAKKGMVELLGSGGDVVAAAINNSGQIVGTDYGTSGFAHAAYWSKSKFYDLGVLAGYESSAATSINATGQIAGNSAASSALRTTLWSVK